MSNTSKAKSLFAEKFFAVSRGNTNFAFQRTKIMKHLRLLLTLAAILLATSAINAQVGDLPRSNPAAEGISSKAISQFFDSLQALPKTDIHHMMVLRHGHVVAECHPAPYRPADAHTLYSASKTLTSLAVGIAIGEHRLSLDDRVVTYFPDMLPDKVTPQLASITVKDLLIMCSGIEPDWQMRMDFDNWIETFLAKPVKYQPGKRFMYDSICTYLLSAILQRVTGKTLIEYLRQHIFAPMHIVEADWELSPEGICTGGWGLRLQTESLAKIGQLMLQRGQWEGRQLVPEAWIEDAIKPHANYDGASMQKPSDKNQGYGYQLWRCLKPGAYRLDGAYGQFVVVDPDTQMVIVILGCSDSTGEELGCIWKYLMPGVGKHYTDTGNDRKRLDNTIRNAALPMPKGKKESSVVSDIDFKLSQNRLNITAAKFYHVDGKPTLHIYYAHGSDETLPLAFGSWAYGHLLDNPPYSINAKGRFTGLRRDFSVAGSYAWKSPTLLQINLQYVNWISAIDIQVNLETETAVISYNYDRAHPETVACAIVRQ